MGPVIFFIPLASGIEHNFVSENSLWDRVLTSWILLPEIVIHDSHSLPFD